MSTEDSKPVANQRECILCQAMFQPHPKVKDRQSVCRRFECQRLRQQLNHVAWLEKNAAISQPVKAQTAEPCSKKNPAPQTSVPQQRKKVIRQKRKNSHRQAGLQTLLRFYEAKKKEQLNSDKTKNKIENIHRKKEQLSDCFYLLRAHGLVFFRLN